MPNWVDNTVAIVGKKENVLRFLNEGVCNSGYKPKKTVKKAFDLLVEKAKRKAMSHKANKLVFEKGLSMATFRPLPDTYLMYDTTNSKHKRDDKTWGNNPKPLFKSDADYEAYSKAYDEAKEYQKNTYGPVGWYDAGCHFWGCKWDAELEGFELDENDTNAKVTFWLQTAWSNPMPFLQWISDTFDVQVFYTAFEESNAFNVIGEVNNDEEDYEDFSGEGAPVEDNFESDDEYWEAYYDYQSAKQDELVTEMYDRAYEAFSEVEEVTV